MARDDDAPISGLYPYARRFGVIDRMPENGRPREEILEELHAMAVEEDGFWQGGQCSGTMYCGDTAHYEFLNEAFGLYSHVNALQRDICPSATRFEGEISAMALDLMHADAVYDVVSVSRGTFFRLDRHQDRLARSCAATCSMHSINACRSGWCAAAQPVGLQPASPRERSAHSMPMEPAGRCRLLSPKCWRPRPPSGSRPSPRA